MGYTMNSFYSFNDTLLVLSSIQLMLPSGEVSSLVERLLAKLREWRQRSRSRRELKSFDEYQLKDIGLTTAQAAFESGKSFLQG
jgi:uncharacterized protein YjiS (DUF1127 family)